MFLHFYFILWAVVSAGYSALLSSSYFERINDDDESTQRSCVHDEEYWTKNRALGDTAGDVYQKDRSVSHFARKKRDDRYVLNQLRTELWIPNQDERRVIKMSWSTVSKKAEMLSKQRHDTFCDPIED